MAGNEIKYNQIDDRFRSIGGLAAFAFIAQLLNANAEILFPDVAATFQAQMDFYMWVLLFFMVCVLFKYKAKNLPQLPPAVTMVKRYGFWFLIWSIVVYLLLAIFDVSFSTFATTELTADTWFLQMVVATMENLTLVMFASALFLLNIGGTGIKGMIVDYLPCATLASLSHFNVYWTQAQVTASKLQEQGVIVDPVRITIISLAFAFIAFTIFYIVYKIWGFASSVALHQTWNLLNGA